VNGAGDAKGKGRKIIEEVGFVGRPADEVFGCITDLEGIGRWMPGVKAEQTAPGRLGVGTTIEMSEKDEPAYGFEVVAYEPGRLFALRGVSDAGPMTMSLGLVPEDGATRVEYSYEVDWESFVAALTRGGKRPDDARLEAAARKRMRVVLDNLKRLIEAGV
jgi:uncharacterized protein YndB with AHSA1/START domain